LVVESAAAEHITAEVQNSGERRVSSSNSLMSRSLPCHTLTTHLFTCSRSLPVERVDSVTNLSAFRADIRNVFCEIEMLLRQPLAYNSEINLSLSTPVRAYAGQRPYTHTKHCQTTTKPYSQWCSRGETRRNAVPPNILWGNADPPNDTRTRGNGNTEALPQAGLQKMQSL